MTRNYKITNPRARLEAQLVVDPSFSLGFILVRYEHSQVNTRWWQRIIVATDDQWLRLSGRDGTHPHETWSQILNERDRPVIPLPMLILGDFVAYAENQAQPETWWLFHWVVWAIDELLRFSPLSPSTKGGTTISPESLEATTQALVDALLDGNSLIPWPTSDGVQLQTLIRLGELVWSFPPDLVRRLVTAFVALNERDSKLLQNPRGQQADSPFIGPGQLVQMSALYLWRTEVPKVRQMSLHMSTFAFPTLIQQALILTHPDAPPIEDTDLAHLCDGGIGQESDPPSPVHAAYNNAVNHPDFSPIASRARIAIYAQESLLGTLPLPDGQWEVAATSRFPLFTALDLQAVRVIALAQGCWVRLIPRHGGWGKVLWWLPQIEPHLCLAFGLGTEREHALVWAVHETMWMLWHEVRGRGTIPS